MGAEFVKFLLLRGLSRSSIHWGDFGEKLQKNFPESEIVCMDLLGNGEYSQLTSPLKISNYTDHLVKQLDSKQKYTIIAMSLGGMVTLDLMHRYPHLVENAFVINSSAKNLSYPWERFSLKVFLKLPLLMFLPPALSEQVIYEITTNKRVIDDQFFEQVSRYPRRTSRLNFLRQLVAAAKFNAPLFHPTKLFLMASRHDRLVNSKISIKMANYYHCPIKIHENAGHDLPFDDGEWMIENIKTVIT